MLYSILSVSLHPNSTEFMLNSLVFSLFEPRQFTGIINVEELFSIHIDHEF